MGVLYAKVGGAWEPVLSGALDLASADARYVNVAGDTMTGQLTVDKAGAAIPADWMLRVGRVGTTSTWFDQNDIQTFGTDGVTPSTLVLQRYGAPLQVGGSAVTDGGLNLYGAAPVGSPFATYSGSTKVGSIFPFGSPLNLVIQSHPANSPISIQASAYVELTAGGASVLQAGPDRVHIYGQGVQDPLRISSTATANNPYIAFYLETAETNRKGYIGRYSAALRVASDDEPVIIRTESAQPVRFDTNGADRGRFDPNGHLLLGTSTAAAGSPTSAWWHPGNGWWYLSNNVVNQPMIITDKVGAGVASGHDFLHFRNNNTTIGSITRNLQQAAVLYNTTSDYRLKDDLGEITGAVDRLQMLKPRRVHWKGSPDADVVDGFFAHEVAVAVPEAVTGQKDAVQPAATDEEIAMGMGVEAGAIIPQQLDQSTLMPLVVAAIKELAAEVAALKGAA